MPVPPPPFALLSLSLSLSLSLLLSPALPLSLLNCFPDFGSSTISLGLTLSTFREYLAPCLAFD
jgi:hypothetical protein